MYIIVSWYVYLSSTCKSTLVFLHIGTLLGNYQTKMHLIAGQGPVLGHDNFSKYICLTICLATFFQEMYIY